MPLNGLARLLLAAGLAPRSIVGIRAFLKVLWAAGWGFPGALGAWIARGQGWCQARPYPWRPPQDPGTDGGPLGWP